MITPEQLAKSGTEHGHQSALFCFAAQSGIHELKWLFAIPNGGLRDKITGGKLKAEGVKAGVPDIFLPIPRGIYHGLFIEMKAGKNVTTDEQNKWLDYLTSARYRCHVCYSWIEAKEAILEYLRMV